MLLCLDRFTISADAGTVPSADGKPFMRIGTVVLSSGAAPGLSALAFSHLFGFAGVNTAMPCSCSWSPSASVTTSS